MSSNFYTTAVKTGSDYQVLVYAVAGTNVESADITVTYNVANGTYNGSTVNPRWNAQDSVDTSTMGTGTIALIDASTTRQGPLPIGSTTDGLLVTLDFTLNTNQAAVTGTANVIDYTDITSPTGASKGTSGALQLACFATGTRIATPSGQVAVEALREGGDIVTHSGAIRPILWIGHRRVNLAAHPSPELVQPIRIRAGAVAEGIPSADLLVSPDHAFLLDGVLVPAHALVNGDSIAQERRATITYWHVELDSHDILLAEGMPAESYLDTGNRDNFADDATTTLHPNFATAPEIYSVLGAAPLATDPAIVRPIWQRLAERGSSFRTAATIEDPGLTVIAGGRRIQSSTDGSGRHIFALPADARDITIASRTARPSDRTPWCGDRRLLGVAISEITLDGKTLDLEQNIHGWYATENEGPKSWRWTDGNAHMTLPNPGRILEIHVHGSLPYARAAA